MTLSPPAATTGPATAPWRFFDVHVAAVTRLSPSYVRLTLTGEDLDRFADNGWDQRFKLLLPDAHGGYARLPRDIGWYAAWRQLPEDRRNPIRTYTVRRVRPLSREVDVDVVLHGDTGPATRFASRARPGDRVVVLGPDAGYAGAHGGLEFRPPPGHRGPTLLAGDATAVPAVLGILEQLPAHAHGEALLEVPCAEDFADAPAPDGFRVTWLVAGAQGSRLPEAVAGLVPARPAGAAGRSGALPEPDDDEPLWDVPEDTETDRLYAWIAGESSLVRELRRSLVRDRGVGRRAVASMGYWRAGRPGG